MVQQGVGTEKAYLQLGAMPRFLESEGARLIKPLAGVAPEDPGEEAAEPATGGPGGPKPRLAARCVVRGSRGTVGSIRSVDKAKVWL